MIPVYEPTLSKLEREYLLDAFDSGWISSKGPFIKKFEDNLAAFHGGNNFVTCSNGTVALHLALLALGIGPGDEILIPDLTYVATANAVLYCGAKPVFVDCEVDTWNICPSDLSKKITESTKAIIVVHLYGVPANIEKICSIAKIHNVKVVEDCAESLGATFRDRLTGTFGDVGTYSFFGNKTITTGEGGAVSCKNEELLERINLLKNQYLSTSRTYWHDDIGYNYRMTNLQAAIGVAQLSRINNILQKKAAIQEMYKSLLMDSFQFQKIGIVHKSSCWMVSILAKNESERDNLRKYLGCCGIETRPLFPCVSNFKMFSNFKISENRIANDISIRGLNLPSSPNLKDEQISYICDSVNSFINQK